MFMLPGGDSPVVIRTLAAAYAETGRFDEAIKTLQTAKDLATKLNRQGLINNYTSMMEHFQKSQPWRSP